MSLKYTEENIKNALAAWKYAEFMTPKKNSIPSLTIDNQDTEVIKSSLMIFKKYSLLPILKLPSHYYVIIDGNIYHPGYPSSDQIYNDTIIDSEESVVMIKECCHHCIYHNMRKTFRIDTKFNILINNCQIILGQFVEFFLLILFIVSTIFIFLFGSLVCFIIMIALIILHIVLNLLYAKTYTYTACPHIKFDYIRTKLQD